MTFDHLLVRDAQGERRIDAADLPLRLGTSSDSDIRLPGPGGSPVIQLDLLDGSPFVQALGRSDSMLLNGATLATSSRLADGDVLNFFGSEIRVSAAERLTLDVRLEDSAYVTQAPEFVEASEEEAIAPQAFRRAAEKAAPVAQDESGVPVRGILAALLLFLVTASFLLFTSKSIQFTVAPGPADDIQITGGWFKLPLGDRVLMRPGVYNVTVTKQGYYALTQSFEVGDEDSDTVELELRPLPGQLVVNTDYTEGVTVTIDSGTVGPAPLGPVELQPGDHSVAISGERFLPYSDIISVEGLGKLRVMNVQLVPRWSDVEISSEPSGASVFDGDRLIGRTPVSVELMEGTHQISVVAEGFRAWDGTIIAEADVDQQLPLIRLQPANARLRVESIPRGANVTVNGRYRGQSPITLDLSPDIDYEIGLSRAGYGSASRQVRLTPAASEAITVDMTATVGEVTVNVSPADATIFVNGRSRRPGTRTLSLSSAPQRIEVRRDGYESWERTITPRPGYPQTVSARLVSLEAIRQASIAREVTTSQDAVLRRVEPGSFTLGASRSDAGRRANEVIVPVTITKPFFIGTREVTNREFREFKRTHDSGADVHVSMAGDNNPVARVTWQEAVQYCNWLSAQEGLQPAYREEFGKWVAITPFPNGYRLPTEAEWAWALRYASRANPPRFSWGDRWPPRTGSGNFADQSAIELLNTLIPRYDDGFASTAPVGRFPANALGLYDAAGNVAEWTNDYYSVPTPGQTTAVDDPTGPTRGQAYVVRGSSWRDATETELRLSAREGSNEARDDVGFRIVRNVE
ncbi:MAG: SUMF1/EgtB/PvdO family nonheme iron enzyme [Pseudomonadota bacterium]